MPTHKWKNSHLDYGEIFSDKEESWNRSQELFEGSLVILFEGKKRWMVFFWAFSSKIVVSMALTQLSHN